MGYRSLMGDERSQWTVTKLTTDIRRACYFYAFVSIFTNVYIWIEIDLLRV